MNLDEEYTHYQESITSLNRAWRTACELERATPGNAIWSAAYRMVIVEYCKPFKKSKINKKDCHKLKTPNLSSTDEALHEQLANLRDKVMAHSDIDALDASVSYDKTAKYPVPIIVKNSLNGLPNISKIRILIEHVLDKLYEKEGDYHAQFKKMP